MGNELSLSSYFVSKLFIEIKGLTNNKSKSFIKDIVNILTSFFIV